MFQIRGKLSNGNSINANVPGKDAPEALATLGSKLAANEATKSLTIVSANVKGMDGGTINIRKPREKKADGAAAAAAPATGRKR
jgi:hypothetical protein